MTRPIERVGFGWFVPNPLISDSTDHGDPAAPRSARTSAAAVALEISMVEINIIMFAAAASMSLAVHSGAAALSPGDRI